MDYFTPPKKGIENIVKAFLYFSAFALFWLAVRPAFAATLYLSPSSESIYAGQSFTVSVFVASPDQAMNAAQVKMAFPINKLSVVSLSKTDSIVNLWVQEPSFSNQDGTIDLQGIVVNPGFQGSSGKLLSITFQAKQTGAASISLISGSVLANDGKGTNITTSMTGSSVSVSAPTPGVPTVGQSGVVYNPAITSMPATADGTWLSIDEITFIWKVPADAAGINFDISSNPDYQMPVIEKLLATSTRYDLSRFADGSWYFFLSFKRGGEWTPAIVKSVALDRTPPEPFTIVQADTDLLNPEPRFKWSAIDQTSGVVRYAVKIGDGDWFDAASIAQGLFYILPPQSPADARPLTVRAYDAAGNFRASTAYFTVKPFGWRSWSSRLWSFVSSWGLVALMLVVGFGGWFAFRSITLWRRSMLGEMADIRKELHQDVERLESTIKKGSAGVSGGAKRQNDSPGNNLGK